MLGVARRLLCVRGREASEEVVGHGGVRCGFSGCGVDALIECFTVGVEFFCELDARCGVGDIAPLDEDAREEVEGLSCLVEARRCLLVRLGAQGGHGVARDGVSDGGAFMIKGGEGAIACHSEARDVALEVVAHRFEAVRGVQEFFDVFGEGGPAVLAAEAFLQLPGLVCGTRNGLAEVVLGAPERVVRSLDRLCAGAWREDGLGDEDGGAEREDDDHEGLHDAFFSDGPAFGVRVPLGQHEQCAEERGKSSGKNEHPVVGCEVSGTLSIWKGIGIVSRVK